MLLKDWMNWKGLNQEAFATKAGLSQGQVSKLVNGKPRRVSADVALKVEDATEGAVRVSDLVSAIHAASTSTPSAVGKQPRSIRGARSATQSAAISRPRRAS